MAGDSGKMQLSQLTSQPKKGSTDTIYTLRESVKFHSNPILSTSYCVHGYL